MHIHAPKAMGEQNPRNPFPLGRVHPSLIHRYRDGPHSPLQTSVPSVHALSHNYATKSPLITVGRPQIHPQNCLCFPFDDNYPHLMHQSLDRRHSPPETQPDPLSRFATVHIPDRQIWSRRETCTKSAYARQRRTNSSNSCRVLLT